MLDLEKLQPIAKGGKKDVYQHPHDDGLLIKVISDRRQKKEACRGLWERLKKPSYTREYLREIDMVYRTVKKAGNYDKPLPIPSIIGLIHTSKGLGLTCEKICDGHGDLAQTLRQIIKQGEFDDIMLNKFNNFVQACFDLQVVTTDLMQDNVVYDRKNDCFRAIDGFGELTAIPLRVWFRSLNDRRLQQQFQVKFADRMAFNWNAKDRRFSF
ncbi:YrbL family protein [Parasulfitobacter algicola]|uniref:PhoP regulatory network protein YrbL n=1 Tax=Parasulfitobacter algicola TaxID=2614809 RepID=A0ABX2ISP6_9RHOB|nr:YrbL family protein [Sulfitobacter algicola]NSX53233.1 hypothetical protein [Sulfitobacter algicola]